MSVSEKLEVISKFQTKMLQDFLSLAISECKDINQKDWREEFRNIVEGMQDKKDLLYINGKELLSKKDFSEINVNDLDISLITALLRKRPFSQSVNKDRVRTCLEGLAHIRNKNAHRTGTETEFDYFRWASTVLYNAEQFLNLIPTNLFWMNNNFNGEEYCRRYRSEITDLEAMIDTEITEYAIGDRTQYAIKFDVDYINGIKGDEELDAYYETQKKYRNIFKTDQTQESYDLYMRFLHACAEAKIEKSYFALFHEYYVGGGKQDGSTVYEPNYRLSAKYFKKHYLCRKAPDPDDCCKMLEFIDYGDIPDPRGDWRARAEKTLIDGGYTCQKIKFPDRDRLYYRAVKKY